MPERFSLSLCVCVQLQNYLYFKLSEFFLRCGSLLFVVTQTPGEEERSCPLCLVISSAKLLLIYTRAAFLTYFLCCTFKLHGHIFTSTDIFLLAKNNYNVCVFFCSGNNSSFSCALVRFVCLVICLTDTRSLPDRESCGLYGDLSCSEVIKNINLRCTNLYLSHEGCSFQR